MHINIKNNFKSKIYLFILKVHFKRICNVEPTSANVTILILNTTLTYHNIEINVLIYRH